MKRITVMNGLKNILGVQDMDEFTKLKQPETRGG